jgi:5-methyltetrahydrofolate--homocysteine methyltransferase
VHTIWIEEHRLARALARNEAFWNGQLEEYPLMWITVPKALPGRTMSQPAQEEELWTNVDYMMEATEIELGRTYYTGDALPVYNPWLGPDQFAGWLGADLILKPKDHNTSWAVPFVQDWENHAEFRIHPDNRWWQLYLEIVRRSVEEGRSKWVTGFPDLHTGIDALSAMRGPERLLLDLIDHPEAILRAMRQMTELWKYVVDTVWSAIATAGQGSSQWTMGWSSRRFLCIGQMDFTCMISPAMFREFCWEDLVECSQHVDYSLYHLDGPGAVPHLPQIYAVKNLNCIQWIPGAGALPLSQWIDLLHQMQAAGKSVQVWPLDNCSLKDLSSEVKILCEELDPSKLFIVAEVDRIQTADDLLSLVRDVCAAKRKPLIHCSEPLHGNSL